VRTVLQRVESARVRVGDEVVARIGSGILALVAIEKQDDESTIGKASGKLAELRIFADERGRMNRSASDCAAEILVVSQFTLASRLARGRRPSFDRAAPPEEARRLLDLLSDQLRDRGLRVACGRFGATMSVESVNDGPVTFVLDL
jgi:D-tyrosyl-tRNA(Tyr) deacylase